MSVRLLSLSDYESANDEPRTDRVQFLSTEKLVRHDRTVAFLFLNSGLQQTRMYLHWFYIRTKNYFPAETNADQP